MQVRPDIVYCPEAGNRGAGDLYLPAQVTPDTMLALTIHGGGWSAQDRMSFAGVAEFLCNQNCAVFNINYRLLSAGPWPLCGDDCLRAARFLLSGGIPELAAVNCPHLLIAGGSAGGHLALMTGLRLPAAQVAGIIAVSGVDDLNYFPPPEGRIAFFGGEPTARQMAEANPVSYICKNQPPVLLTHSIYDSVVPFAAAGSFVGRCRAAGAPVELYRYERNDPAPSHCIWMAESRPKQLYPDLRAVIRNFIIRNCRNTAD